MGAKFSPFAFFWFQNLKALIGFHNHHYAYEHRATTVSYTHLDVYKRQPIHQSDQGNHPDEVVEPGIDDQSLERSAWIADGRRNALDDLLHQFHDPEPALGADPQGVAGVQPDNVADLVGLSLIHI